MTAELRKRISENEAKGFKFKRFEKAPQGGWYAVYEKQEMIDSFTAKINNKLAQVSGDGLGQWTGED
jgi:hypothetical protein